MHTLTRICPIQRTPEDSLVDLLTFLELTQRNLLGLVMIVLLEYGVSTSSGRKLFNLMYRETRYALSGILPTFAVFSFLHTRPIFWLSALLIIGSTVMIFDTRIPWGTLSGHDNAISYVRFLCSETLVSASTDNTLKLWDLKKTSLDGLSPDACSLTFKGHTNGKNFVGLAVLDAYIACGSETNEGISFGHFFG